MRVISIFILFTILALFSTTTLSRKKREAESDLKLITEDFRILARVTNAIYFHFAAIKKQVKIGDVIAEIFRIPKAQFFPIVMAGGGNIDDEIERMREAYSNFNSAINGMNSGIKLTLDQVVNDVYVLNFLKNLPEKLKEAEEASKMPANSLLVETSNFQHNAIFSYCDDVEADILERMVELFFFPEDYQFLDDVAKRQVIKDFKEQIQPLKNCLKRMKDLKSDTEKLKILEVDELFDKAWYGFELAGDFSQIFNIGENVESNLEKLEKNLKISHPIWLIPQKNETSHETAIKNDIKLFDVLNGSLTGFSDYQKSVDPIELIHTAGIRNSGELLEIFEDIESPWFQKKVARGASTKNLSLALEPYRKISQMIVELDSSWQHNLELQKDDLGDSAMNGGRTLNAIKEFAINFENYAEDIHSFKATFKRCVGLKNPNFNSNIFDKFEKEQINAEHFVKRVKYVKDLSAKISDRLSNRLDDDSEANIDKVGKVLDLVEKTILDENKPAVDFIYKMFLYLYSGEHRDPHLCSPLYMHTKEETQWLETIKDVVDLKKKLKQLKEKSKNVTVPSPTIEIKTILDDLRISQISNCFETAQEKLGKVLNCFEAFQNILKFPKDEITDNLISYLREMKKVAEGIIIIQEALQKLNSERTNDSSENLIQPMNNAKALSESFGESIHVLEQLEAARAYRESLLEVTAFSPETQQVLASKGLVEWILPENALRGVLNAADTLNLLAKDVRNEDLVEMARVFENASNIVGLEGKQSQLRSVYEDPRIENDTERAYFGNVKDLDLDFAKHHARLVNARVTTNSLKMYFDEIFGHAKPKTVTVERQIPVSWTAIICIGLGLIFLVIIIVMAIYGLTEKGRAHYKCIYIYYFGKPEDFEKRWRYSMFMDRVDGKNALLDAAREGNTPNLIKALKSGAYIDAYNKLGNTALHIAVKLALPDHVELLIKHGADRNLLNYKNLVPIQMIPTKNVAPDRVPKYEKIKRIYKKYHKKSFRITVPKEFPVSSFHIWPDENTDIGVANNFLDCFRAITSDEAIPTTTHMVFKTDKNGVLETDDLNALIWILHGVIIVKEQWMIDCCNNESLISKDKDYLIEKVKYKGVIYDTVIKWSEAMAKAEMPFLLGAYVVIAAKTCKDPATLATIITNQGGVVTEKLFFKTDFTLHSRPYLHANLGPIFIIHDETEDVSAFKNDLDNMYTVFTEEAFISFLLKRKTNIDKRTNPPAVVIGDE